MWVKGQSGNPAGKPKGVKNKLSLYRQKIEDAVDADQVLRLINRLYRLAMKNGDAQAAKLYLEYTVGKPLQQVDMTQKIEVQNDPDEKRRREEILKRYAKDFTSDN